VTDKQRSCCWANQNTGRRRCNCLLTYCEPTANRISQWTWSLNLNSCRSSPATWIFSSWNEPAFQGLLFRWIQEIADAAHINHLHIYIYRVIQKVSNQLSFCYNCVKYWPLFEIAYFHWAAPNLQQSFKYPFTSQTHHSLLAKYQWQLLNTNISQGSVATRLRYDEIFSDHFIAYFLLNDSACASEIIVKIDQYLMKLCRLWTIRCV